MLLLLAMTVIMMMMMMMLVQNDVVVIHLYVCNETISSTGRTRMPKTLNYRRETARRAMSDKILSTAPQLHNNHI